MTSFAPFALLLLGGLALAGCEAAQSKPTAPDHSAERGRYLVESVGMCQDCHSPMTPTGPDRSRWLQGAELPFTPAMPIPGWATVAPAIAGLPTLDDEDAITLLSTGALPGGVHLGPPMPHYTMNRDDATAVVAYLRSLAPAAAR